MHCVTVSTSSDQRTFERDKDRRVSRGLPSCLRGERDDVDCKYIDHWLVIFCAPTRLNSDSTQQFFL